MRGTYEGVVEVNCKGVQHGRKCGATLEVKIKSGLPTVTVLATKKA
jgi:hypothetical protein